MALPQKKVKKCRKLRGHVSHGHGRIGKHRKNPGGKGNAGGLTHHRINFDKYHPGYFTKKGMRDFHIHPNRNWCKAINVEQLWGLLSIEQREKYSKNIGKPIVIDIGEAGYQKLLGKGHLPPRPIVVKARYISKMAEYKLKENGGVCILTG
ncbi:60S ribosomal protein L27a [Intoshia linei]|uniref:Large ribosomal subunit protein uL15 n=1 Tax=Intoshia linei TaxID=1819745 RepID=A0A177BAA9_9BILA|nr:60S ribosomal protein L27a [Intoshia linei]